MVEVANQQNPWRDTSGIARWVGISFPIKDIHGADDKPPHHEDDTESGLTKRGGVVERWCGRVCISLEDMSCRETETI